MNITLGSAVLGFPRVASRVFESRSLTYSVLIHLILVLLLGGVVLVRTGMVPDFPIEAGVQVPVDPSAPPPVSIPLPSNEAYRVEVAPPGTGQSLIPVVNSTNVSPFIASPSLPAVGGVPDEVKPMLSRPPAIPKVGFTASNSLSQRFGTDRMAALTRNGGTQRSEQAVMAGLRWLQRNQKADGSWSDANTSAMTGLALLCFLGHGELPDSTEFGPTVKRGLDWLLQVTSAREGRATENLAGSLVYEHAIATYAMAEYFTMTHDERFAEPLRKAVAYIVQGQNPVGGWDYGYAKGPRNDLSVAGWQIQALKAAHLTGLNLPGVDEALDRSLVFLKQWQGPQGGFGYDKPGDNYSLTGAGVLCTYFWKQSKDKSVRDGIEFLLKETERSRPVKYRGESADLYAWYYHTQACLTVGGQAWAKWNHWFQTELAQAQSPDGSWPVTVSKAAGPQSSAAGAGPYYRTALCVLMLEVFYRYMPINK